MVTRPSPTTPSRTTPKRKRTADSYVNRIDARSRRLAAEGRIVSPAVLMQALLAGFGAGDQEQDAVKLARSRGLSAAWQKPNGDLIEENTRNHGEYAARAGDTILGLMQKGWNRVVSIGDELIAHNEYQRPTTRQVSELADHAMIHGFKRVTHDDGTDENTLWSHDEDDGPQRLARVAEVAKAGSINKAGRLGKTFLKESTDSGSPWAEEAAHKALTLLDVPHIPMHARELPSGKVVNHSPWVDGVKSVSDVAREPGGMGKLKASVNPEQVAKTVLGEWVIGAGDRIGRNYAVHPQLGLIGNDYGHSFHPLTDEWVLHRKNGNSPVESYKSLAKTASKYAEYHPNSTALASLLPHVGLTRDDFHALPVPSETISRLDSHYHDLIGLARHAVKDLPEAEAAHAVTAMKARLDAIRDHVRRTGALTIRDLIGLTDKVRNEATARSAGPV